MTRRVVHFLLLLAASWCVMVTTHEAGHVVCGWAGGGTLQHADLLPWHLPHSHFDPDPFPLLTLWGGPALGALVPLAAALLLSLRSAEKRISHGATPGGSQVSESIVSPPSLTPPPHGNEPAAPPGSGRSAWFIAHFCLLANGCYLAAAWYSGERYLDTPRLLAAGAHPATILAYCAVTIAAGYAGFRAECAGVLSPKGR